MKILVFVGHPLDTVKVRLQIQDANNKRYSGVIDCIRKTTAHEGVRYLHPKSDVKVFAFYKGASSPLYMAAFYSAILFFAYGQAKRLFHDERNNYFTFREMVNIGKKKVTNYT